ncbi:hypothetical protein LTR09_004408 [Extremus antarcticus]|uniref:Aminoglycoside phosphotransferase domain-containing protein n=1 Tax=Extremus antarcticus TaxID=702011 RepID=A0AAJ0DIE3_9PEZI|nr:hypothetical protein LTR09_004408 [Extremus antarcticus]
MASPDWHHLCHGASQTRQKAGYFTDLTEAASMEFVRQNTSIPVPKVYCAFRRKSGRTYIVMQRSKSHKPAIGWQKRSEDSKLRILTQLKAMIDEMRSLKSPYRDAVTSACGGSLFDDRLPGLSLRYPVNTSSRFGPFEDIRAFHRWLRRPATDINESNFHEINELIAAHENMEWSTPVFTHGDLSSLNILVKDDRVVGIVDWEMAGWFPSYWGFTTASQVNFRNLMWAEYVDKFLEPKPKEWKTGQIRMKYFGDL